MPKYMIQASYTADGTKGVMKEGGTKRRATVEANVKAAGGTVEAFYFAFGEADAFVIVDLPDNASAAALSMAVNASGAVAFEDSRFDDTGRSRSSHKEVGSVPRAWKEIG